jgi:hypothetical protein
MTSINKYIANGRNYFEAISIIPLFLTRSQNAAKQEWISIPHKYDFQ